MRSQEFFTPDSSKHSAEPTTVSEYTIPQMPDRAPDTEGETDPSRKKSRRGLFTAVGAAAGLAASIGIFMSTQGGASSERPSEPREPGVSAPAVPGETDPSAPAENKEKLTAVEMVEAFNKQIESNLDKEIEAQPGVNFEQDDRKVSLNVLDALSDWTTTGITKENLAAYNKMSDASVDADLSTDDFNSIPSLTEVSELIADKVSEKEVEKLGFEKIDDDTLRILNEVNANNILAGLTALDDKTGEVEPFESKLVPEAMTEPFNYNGTHSVIKFTEQSASNKYKKDLFVRDMSDQEINMLVVAVNEEGDNVKRVRMTEIPPSQPLSPIEAQN